MLFLSVGLLSGCETVAYGWQAWQGHRSLMSERQPIEEVLIDPGTPEPVRTQLAQLQLARIFATDHLFLPDNDSYAEYVALERSYVVKNVFAAPEFELDLKRWCYPVAGCVSYQGYFDEQAAERFASKWRGKGYDVFVGNVSAYSTLGRFQDPVVSSMLSVETYETVALMFHELAHQLIYIKNDTAFNESFASFVEFQGVSEWLHDRQDYSSLKHAEENLQRWQQIVTTYTVTENALNELFDGSMSEIQMRAGKQALYADLARRIDHLNKNHREQYSAPRNNAELLAYRSYEIWLAAFSELYLQADCNWSVFYESVEKLGRLPSERRRQELAKTSNGFSLVDANDCTL
ncbi:MAG: aminopeptidase [Gammaproteobacteria bacterium]|nr:aminopeptidase [Gammaproteobacteria bacterium]